MDDRDVTLPFYVVVYYHVEPNIQLFESIEEGYFEAVSRSLRDMSSDLAGINARATFCFAWLYVDLTYCRNRDPQTGEIVDQPGDTGIETFQRIVADGHELAYHTHPANALRIEQASYYTRPDSDCERFDNRNAHRWKGAGTDYRLEFQPGQYQFDDPDDPWFGQFTWERTSESLFKIADYLGVSVRHANGGQKPMLDVMNRLGQGINHDHSLRQIYSMMNTGFDLISPEVIYQFNAAYDEAGDFWRDPSTGYVSYLGSGTNVQIYYPNVNGGFIERPAMTDQGLTFMPVHIQGQVAWTRGDRDARYYDPEPLGGTGGGGIRWREDAFYQPYTAVNFDPWAGEERMFEFPSLADQFNSSMRRHSEESPAAVNAWGFNHHVVNVMWADFTGLSDNWDQEVDFLRDIADGEADGVINPPRSELVQFVTMQELSAIYDSIVAGSR
jgi:hypothetical protein